MKDRMEEKHSNEGIPVKKYSTFQNMCYIMKGMWKWSRPVLPLTVLGIIGDTAFTFIPMFILKYVIDYVQSNAPLEGFLKTIIILGLIELVCAIANIMINTTLWPRRFYVRLRYILLRSRKIYEINYEYLENPKILDSIEKAEVATRGLHSGIEGMMLHATTAALNLTKVIVASVILITLNPVLLLVILGVELIRYRIADQTGKRVQEDIRDPLARYNRKVQYMDTTFKNFEYGKDIRIFNMKKFLNHKQKDVHEYVHNEVRREKSIWMKTWVNDDLINLAKDFLLLCYLVYKVLQKNMAIGSFTMYVGSVQNFSYSMSEFFKEIVEIKRCSRELNDYRSFLEFETESEEDYIKIPKASKYEIIFEKVSFRYPGSDQYALKDISIRVEAGKRLAVVGLNGAGKSTFIKLLCGLYKPTEGKIYLNGMDIGRFRPEEYFELFSPVFQNVECYAFPLMENVSMNYSDHTDKDRVTECLTEAGLGEKLASLPEGIYTELLKYISDSGVELSGGEKQKMALARALYKNAPIVILDEPTSALDAVSEKKMYEDFDSLIGGKTSVFISHRLSSTQFCDVIAMFSGGQLTQYGTHSELMNSEGEYAHMFKVQARYYAGEQVS